MAKKDDKNPKKKVMLTREQQIWLVTAIQDGHSYPDIKEMAQLRQDPFVATQKVIEYWKTKAKTGQQKMNRSGTSEVWSTGLATAENRIDALKKLAERMMVDLCADDKDKERIWLERLKAYGAGQNFFTQTYWEFNASQLVQFRGLLEDIAKETGGRSRRSDDASQLANMKHVMPADAIAAPFLDVFRSIKAGEKVEYLLKGGRGSTKSSFTSLALIYLLLNNPTLHCLALRQVANTLRDSVYAQIIWALGELGISDQFKKITNPLEIEYLPTGQKIYFRGADNPEKIKSIKPVFGYIGIVWFEELDQFHGPEAVRRIEQSVLRGGDAGWEFKTYNPPRSVVNWVNRYSLIPKKTQYTHHSTYLDVPSAWLGATWVGEAEHLKEVNRRAYDHEYLGEVNGTGGQVFENVEIRRISATEMATFNTPSMGVDWGYFPDPYVWSKSYYNPATLTLYIYDEYMVNKASNRDTSKYLFETKGVRKGDILICDSAEPKSIGDYLEYGHTARGAEKGPDSVSYSIKWLQSLTKIVIDPSRCPHHAREFLEYELEMDKEENYISGYPDKNNHTIDSVRYAHNLRWRRRGQ